MALVFDRARFAALVRERALTEDVSVREMTELVAHRCGVEPETARAWKRPSGSAPAERHVPTIAEALGVEPGELLDSKAERRAYTPEQRAELRAVYKELLRAVESTASRGRDGAEFVGRLLADAAERGERVQDWDVEGLFGAVPGAMGGCSLDWAGPVGSGRSALRRCWFDLGSDPAYGELEDWLSNRLAPVACAGEWRATRAVAAWAASETRSRHVAEAAAKWRTAKAAQDRRPLSWTLWEPASEDGPSEAEAKAHASEVRERASAWSERTASRLCRESGCSRGALDRAADDPARARELALESLMAIVAR